jgi:uncharacterized protein YbaR (Trm112 family)
VAVDLAEVAMAMRVEEEVLPLVLVCPYCAEAMLPPTDGELSPYVECPACERRFALEEGMPHLHGTGLDAE